MMIFAIVENGVVVNVVEWNDVASWQAPQSSTIVQIPSGVYAGIGSTYANGTFSPPPQSPGGL